MEKQKLNWKKYLPYFTIVFILLLGAFFRLYRIREYMLFLGDEGRDMLVVKRMLIDHKFTLLGPITSVGSMYMGPVYYYMMAPFLFLSGFDPVGPSIMVALFSIFTILLLFLWCRDFVSVKAGILAAFFYAISPLTIVYGRASWNPNVVPFFAILLIYSFTQVIIKKHYLWIAVTGFTLGILMQLHYVTILFIPIILAGLLLIKFGLKKRYYLLLVFGWLVAYSPFLLFELRHQFVNLKAVFRFLTTNNSRPFILFLSEMVNTIKDVTVRLFWRLLVIENAQLTKIFLFTLSILLFLYWREFRKNQKKILIMKILLIWFIIGIFSFGLYQGTIYDYYFGSLFPLPFLLTGILFDWLLKRNVGKIAVIAMVIILSILNFKNSPLRAEPNNLLKISETIARFVYNQTGGKPYNFALIADKNSDHAYRYFLELWGRPPVLIEPPDVDPQRRTVTNQLLVVCEEKICNPLGHPLWEIAGFGRAEIETQWQVETAKVFRLVPYKDI